MKLDRTIRIDFCSLCKLEKPIANQTLCLCIGCNQKRLRARRSIRSSGQSRIKPKSHRGEKTSREDDKFFRGIWRERKHVSEVSGEPLGEKFQAVFMSHVLSKQAFPGFRYLKRNIVLMTFDEHRMWGDVPESDSEFQIKFKKVLELKSQLKMEYYQRERAIKKWDNAVLS